MAYASRTLSDPKKGYAITELETLAVVWALNHFHAYLYGHNVVVYTDHSAVKAVLETPNISAKHMLDGGPRFMGVASRVSTLCTDQAERMGMLMLCHTILRIRHPILNRRRKCKLLW